VLHAARWKYRTQKLPSVHHRTTLSGYVFATKALSTIGKNLLNSNTSSTCHYNMVKFAPLTAEICWRVWGTTANFNGFRVLAAILHGTLVVGVSQTLRRWTDGATYRHPTIILLCLHLLSLLSFWYRWVQNLMLYLRTNYQKLLVSLSEEKREFYLALSPEISLLRDFVAPILL